MRETSLAFVGLLVLAMVYYCPRGSALRWFLVGLAAPIIVECLGYALATGDPFYRFRLALEHNLIRSSELRRSVDIHAQPLFNPAFIAGETDTGFIERHKAALAPATPDEEMAALAAIVAAAQAQQSGTGEDPGAGLDLSKTEIPAWRREKL